MDELFEIFNKIKKQLYGSDKKYSIREINKAVLTCNKEVLGYLMLYVKTMLEQVEDMGSKIFDISAHSIDNNILLYSNFEGDISGIVRLVDTFVDSFKQFINLIKFEENRYFIKKKYIYLKTVRDNLVKNINEYKKKILKIKSDENNFKVVLNDTIDVFIKESCNFRLLTIYNILKKRKSK